MKTVASTTTSSIVLTPSARQNQNPSSYKSAKLVPKTSNRVRKPLGLVTQCQSQPFVNPSSCEEMKIDAWYADVLRELGPSPINHRSECVSSIRAAVNLIIQIQKIHPELFVECNALQRALRNIIKLVEAHYRNETWLDVSPPTSISKTLRRVKNWGQSVLRSSSAEVVPASQVQDFTRKFQQIVKSMSVE